MAYTWSTGETITAEKLNNTGSGVLIVNSNYDESTEKSTLDKTWKEIYDAFANGKIVIIMTGSITGGKVLGLVYTVYTDSGSNNNFVCSKDFITNSLVKYMATDQNSYPVYFEDPTPGPM